MNLNEVKKHVTFQLILYILIGVCFLLSIFAILTTPVKAQEQTSSLNPVIKTDYNCPYGSGATGYCAVNTDNTGGVRALGTQYNGVLSSLSFVFPYYFSANGQSLQTITINANTNDFRNNNLSVYCYSYESSPTQSVVNNCSLRFIDQKKIQVVMQYDHYMYHEIIIIGTPLTGISNYRINSITITYDDGQQDNSGIINNATQNTTDIINNNNSNTSAIIDNQNQNTETTNNTIWQGVSDIVSTIASRCTNKIDMSKITLDSGVTASSVSAVTGSITIDSVNNKGFWTDYMTIEQGTDYYFNYSQVGSGGYIFYAFFYDSNKTQLSSYRIYGGKICQNQSACYPVNAKYMRIHVVNYQDGQRSFTGLRVTPSSNVAFCQYGTNNNNKLDGIQGAINSGLTTIHDDNEEIKDLQQEANDIAQDQYNWLSDDSNPTVNQSGISDVISSVEVSDPLNYLLTLPISLLQKLNTVLSANSCSRVSFGSLYETELYLPCINFENILGSSIWGTIDLIVGVGLLAIILKKFYDSISNILTLGKEKEVRDKLDLPTPMQFLAHILGGGKE